MEELRSTRHWGKKPHESTVFARSAYNDFFRGPPGHTTSFPSRFEDYCEIFGKAASASSIPVLDLPPADEDFMAVGQVVVDYSEIFRGLSGGSFAVSYEELFGGSKRSGVSSLNGRALWGVLSEEQLANLEMAEVSSVPNHSDDASSKQFGTSSYRTSRGIIDDLIGEETKTAKFDAIPEFMVVVDPSDPVLAMKSKQVNKWITNNTDTNRYIHDGGQENEAPSNSSSNGANSENLQVEQAPSEFICDSLLDASQNEIHHSRSSSYHSASSGDINVEYFNISEISLQTKSLQEPPPSRPPPQLIKKSEHSKMVHIDSNSNLEGGLLKDHMDSSSGASKIHAIDEYMDDDDSCCYDSEMDPSSAVAASVASVKAAMKHAQARLKIAKELMDRKRDKYTRKVDQPEAASCEEDGADFDVALKSGSKVMAANNLLKQNNHSYTFLEWEEIKNAGPTSLKHEKKERFPSSGENQHQVAPDNVLKSTEAACEFDELSGDWKTEKKYYELIRNGSLLNEVKDHYMQENEKKAKTATHGCHNLYKDSKKGEQAFEVLENKKSSEGFNLNGASMAYMKDSNKNVANAIMEDFLLTESASKLNEAYNCHLLNDTQKEGDVHEDSTTEDGDNSLNSALDSGLRRDSEMMFQALNSGFESGADNSFCEGIEFSGAEKISRNVGSKMEFHASHVDFELNESHKLFKVENEAVFQGRSDEKSRVSDGLCSNNTTDKMEVAEETRKFDEKVRERESMRYLYASNVSACKVEESNNAAEVDEADGLQANEEACILTKYELEKERRDTPIELQEDESMRLHRNQEVHNFEFLSEAEINCAEKGSENTSEVPVACNLVENQIISTSAKEIQHCKESNDPVIILSGKEENSPDKAPDTTEVFHAEVAENHRHSIHTEDEEDKKSDTEKERDQKQAMILEEKEREREREKDRISVERANHDARQREFAESRERAERIAAERVIAEARQRALAESREKTEKSADTEKASREARLRAERAAVERATEEARQRAIEKALAERASIEARSRMRKGNATVHFKAANVKEDSSSEILQNTQSQGPASFTNGQRYSDSWDNGESESKLRCKARQERHQRTAERAAKALAEKNLRDILVQREQAERDRISESLDSEVRRWSGGKEGNLRALLSTLQYILVGSDSGWQPIPLTNVLTAAAVKKAYRKATLCVHPDKLQQRGATIQQKYICEKVFDLLKEAWNKFNSEER